MTAGITPVVKASLVDMAEGKLREFIRAGGLKPGDAVPRELELAEALGVSRSVVREAVSRMRMLGQLDCRRRRGTVVAAPDVLAGIERLMAPEYMDAATAREIFELRLTLEIGLADLLFLRRTPAALAELRTIVAREAAAAPGRFRYHDCDIRFHEKIFAIAGNAFMRRLQGVVASFFEASRKWDFVPGQTPVPGLPTHANLVDILEHGTPREYRDTMALHFKPYFDALRREQAGAGKVSGVGCQPEALSLPKGVSGNAGGRGSSVPASRRSYAVARGGRGKSGVGGARRQVVRGRCLALDTRHPSRDATRDSDSGRDGRRARGRVADVMQDQE